MWVVIYKKQNNQVDGKGIICDSQFCASEHREISQKDKNILNAPPCFVLCSTAEAVRSTQVMAVK